MQYFVAKKDNVRAGNLLDDMKNNVVGAVCFNWLEQNSTEMFWTTTKKFNNLAYTLTNRFKFSFKQVQTNAELKITQFFIYFCLIKSIIIGEIRVNRHPKLIEIKCVYYRLVNLTNDRCRITYWNPSILEIGRWYVKIIPLIPNQLFFFIWVSFFAF